MGALLTGVILTTTNVGTRESASTEVSRQIDFVLQTIGRLVRESSNIDIPTGTRVTSLTLRMQPAAKDPTCISLVGTKIVIFDPDPAQPGTCNTTGKDLTSNRVTVDRFDIKKFASYPGKDTVSIDLQLTYNSQNPQESSITRSITTAISRVSAATFDSNLLPGPVTPPTYEIGQSGSVWKKIYLDDGNFSNPSYTFGNSVGTGLFLPQNNVLGFGAGGAREAMRIDGTGQTTLIGIGTQTPTVPLEVVGAIQIHDSAVTPNNSYQGILRVTRSSASGQQINLTRVGTPDYAWSIGTVYNSNNFAIGTASSTDSNFISPQLAITSGGNIGIGTANPATKLEIANGDVLTYRSGSAAFPAFTSRAVSTIGAPYLIFERSSETGNGSGIPAVVQTGNALGALSFRGYDGSIYGGPAGGNADIRAYAEELFTSTNKGASIRLYTTADGSQTITERVRITPDGSVVVASSTYQTSNSNASLEVHGVSPNHIVAQFKAEAGATADVLQLLDGAGALLLSMPPSGNLNVDANTFVVNAVSNRVGVGVTDPLDKLHVNGEVRVLNCVKNSGGTQIAGTCPSDARLKKNITPFPNVLDKLIQLQPAYFFWKSEEYPEFHFGKDQSFGLIAQDVEKVMPELVSEDENGFKMIQYHKLPLLLLQAVKELRTENQDLSARIQALEAKMKP